MRALLDTNIVIHRENTRATNYSIGQLFYWLDRLHHEKVIHPLSVKELRGYNNQQVQELYNAKLDAYTVMRGTAVQTDDFRNLLEELPLTDNDVIDNQLLFEVYCGRVDFLITEDRKMRIKAEKLGIQDKVYSINAFVTKCTSENPELINYQALSVRKTYFGDVDIKDPFFDTFREAYPKFNLWFAKKCDQEAYICKKDNDMIQGFLYLKVEGHEEPYYDITPAFTPKKRLKVGTFKVESTGFRLGERFVKIIFDNAIEQKVDEIYVTLFNDRPELKALHELLVRWGFREYGIKKSGDREEIVMVKLMNTYNESLSIKENFPNLNYNHTKFYLPIEAQYHTPLLPDSMLKTENEIDFIGKDPQKYALQKVYISFTYKRDMKPGDIILLYRKGTTPGKKGYESTITSVGVIDEVKHNFASEDEFFKYCENRSIFTKDELGRIWSRGQGFVVVKFIFVKSLEKRLTLNHLWDNGYIARGAGPRPFDRIPDEQFNNLLKESQTEIYM